LRTNPSSNANDVKQETPADWPVEEKYNLHEFIWSQTYKALQGILDYTEIDLDRTLIVGVHDGLDDNTFVTKYDIHTCALASSSRPSQCVQRFPTCVKNHFPSGLENILLLFTGTRVTPEMFGRFLQTGARVYVALWNFTADQGDLPNNDIPFSYKRTSRGYEYMIGEWIFASSDQNWILNNGTRPTGFGTTIHSQEVVDLGIAAVYELRAVKDVGITNTNTRPFVQATASVAPHPLPDFFGEEKKIVPEEEIVEKPAPQNVKVAHGKGATKHATKGKKGTRAARKNAQMLASMRDAKAKEAGATDAKKEKQKESADPAADNSSSGAKTKSFPKKPDKPDKTAAQNLFECEIAGFDAKRCLDEKERAYFQADHQSFDPILRDFPFRNAVLGHHLVVNPWALVEGTNMTSYSYKINGDLIRIEGPYVKGQYRSTIVANLLIWDGQNQLRLPSDNGLFGFTVDVGPPNWIYDHSLTTKLVMTAEDRLKVIMEANVYRWFGKLALDEVGFRNLVKGHFKRFNRDNFSLDLVISKLLNSEWWAEVVCSYTEHTALNWRCHSRLVLYQLAATRGYSQFSVDRMISKGLCWKRFCYFANPINTTMAVMGCNEAPNFEMLAINDIYDSIIPSVAPRLIPCAMMLRKRVRYERALPACGTRYKIKFDPNHERYEREPEDVAIYGVAIKDVPVVLPNLNSETLHAAVRIRMSVDTPVCPITLGEYRDFAVKALKQLPKIVVPEFSEQQHMEHFVAQYGQRRAAEIMTFRGCELGPEEVRGSMFPKNEAYVGKTPGNFKPRMIFSRHPAMLAHFALPLHYVGNQLKNMFNKNSNCYYSNSASPDDVGQFCQLASNTHPYIVEQDDSNFDGTCFETQQDLEDYFFTHCVENMPEEYAKVIATARTFSAGSHDKLMSVQKSCGRNSGDLITSMCNTLHSILEFMFAYGYDWSASKWKGIFLGDDNVTFHKQQPDMELAMQRLTGIGRIAKMIPRERLELAEYCSGYFWIVDGVYRWGNKPMKFLSKMGINYHRHSEKEFQGLLYGTSLGGLCTGGHVPWLGAILRGLARSAKEKGIRKITDSRGMNPYRIQGGVCLYPSIDTYQQFADMYSLPIEFVMEIDSWLEMNIDISQCPFLIDDDIFRRCAQMELQFDEVDLDPTLNFEPTALYFTQVAPLSEEVEKLKNVDSIVGAMAAGRAFGAEEDRVFGTTNHAFLHGMFSAVSFINLDLGVEMHSRFNVYALQSGLACCTKKKKKPAPKPQPKKKKKQSASKFSAWKTLAEIGGGLVGGYLGGPSGAAMGSAIGGSAATIFGQGAYGIKHNTLIEDGVPKFSGLGTKGIRIQNKEYIGNVGSTTAFTTTSIPLNPGLYSVAPWLAKMANNYSAYTYHGLAIVFVSTSGDSLNSTNTALGSIIMATQYDVEAEPFQSKQQMEMTLGAVSGRPSVNLIHGVECKPSMMAYKKHFVRAGEIDADDDLRLYDHATFVFATDAMQAVSEIGELWITYDVEFFFPRISSNPSAASYFIYSNVYSSNAVPLNGTTGAATVHTYGSLPITIGNAGINFSPLLTSGTYYIEVTWNSDTATTVTLASMTPSSNMQLDADYTNAIHPLNTPSVVPAIGATLTTSGSVRGFFRILGYSLTANNVAVSTGMTLPAVSSAGQVVVKIFPVFETLTED